MEAIQADTLTSSSSDVEELQLNTSRVPQPSDNKRKSQGHPHLSTLGPWRVRTSGRLECGFPMARASELDASHHKRRGLTSSRHMLTFVASLWSTDIELTAVEPQKAKLPASAPSGAMNLTWRVGRRQLRPLRPHELEQGRQGKDDAPLMEFKAGKLVLKREVLDILATSNFTRGPSRLSTAESCSACSLV